MSERGKIKGMTVSDSSRIDNSNFPMEIAQSDLIMLRFGSDPGSGTSFTAKLIKYPFGSVITKVIGEYPKRITGRQKLIDTVMEAVSKQDEENGTPELRYRKMNRWEHLVSAVRGR